MILHRAFNLFAKNLAPCMMLALIYCQVVYSAKETPEQTEDVSRSGTRDYSRASLDWQEQIRLGKEQELEGNFVSASRFYNQSLKAAASIGKNSNEMLESFTRLANVLVAQKRLKEAAVYIERVLALGAAKKKDKTIGRECLVWIDDLSDTLKSMADPSSDSAFCLDNALALRDLISGNDHPKIAECLFPIATRKMHEEKFEEAARLTRRLVTVNQKKLGHNDLRVANELFMLAHIELKLRRLGEAESYCRQALAIYLGSKQASMKGLVNVRILLAQILLAASEPSLAAQEASQALLNATQSVGERSAETIRAREVLAEAKFLDGKLNESLKLCQENVSVIEKDYGMSATGLVPSLDILRKIYLKQGQLSKAKSLDSRIKSLSR